MWKLNKIGLSEVVSTVLLILLSVAFVGGVFFTVRTYVEENIGRASCNEVFEKFVLESRYSCFDSSSNSLVVSISREKIAMDSLLVSIYSQDESKNFFLEDEPKEIEGVRYYSSEILPGLDLFFDNATAVASNRIDNLTFSFTVGDSENRILFVEIVRKGSTHTTNITYGEKLFSMHSTYDLGYVGHMEIWYMTEPPTGENEVIATFSDSSNIDIMAGAISFSGINQTNPFGNFSSSTGSGTFASLGIVTTINNSIIVDFFGARDFVSVGNSQTQRFYSDLVGVTGISSTRETPNATLYTNTWSLSSSRPWGAIIFELNPYEPLSQTPSGDEVSAPGNESGKTYCVSGFSAGPTEIEIAPKINGFQCGVVDSIKSIQECATLRC